MEASIRVDSGDSQDLLELARWLGEDEDLRGKTRLERQAIAPTELGALPELIAVALGAGGVGSALASALVAWIKTRRTSATITVQANDRTVTLDIHTIGDVTPMLEKILNSVDEPRT